MTTPTQMSWADYVGAWARAYDGYDLRQATAGQRGGLRLGYRVGSALGRWGLTPGYPLLLSWLFALLVPVLAAARGWWALLAAVFLLLGLGLAAVSRVTTVLQGRSSRLNSFYLSLTDRMAEVCWLAAFSALGVKPVVIVLCGAVLWVHEYVRARAAAAGMRNAGAATIGDRPIRIVLTLVALVLAGLSNQLDDDLGAGVATLIAFAWLCLGLIGVGQLLTIVRKVLASAV